MFRLRGICVAGVLAVSLCTACAQVPAQAKKKTGGCKEPPVAFKSVSIHARDSMYAHLDGYTNEGFSMMGATFRAVIGYVFATDRIEGLPNWAQHDQYDVIAEIKPDDCCQWSGESDAEESLAVQKVLQDRLKMKWHTETRMVKAFSLVVGKNGSKLGAPEPPVPSGPNQTMGNPFPERGYWPGIGTMKDFVEYLSIVTRHPVIDNTGLAGRYKISLPYGGYQFNSDRLIEPDGTPSPIPPQGPSIYDDLAKLGLELKSDKIPMDFLVIDQIERPDGN